MNNTRLFFLAISSAIEGENVEKVRTLLATYKDVECLKAISFKIIEEIKVTPLYLACNRGKIEIVKLLVDAVASIDKGLNHRCVDGCTAFYVACQINNIEIAEYLLSHGADINIPDEDGNSPLMSALSCDKVELFQFLIDNNAKISNLDTIRAKELGRKKMYAILKQRMQQQPPPKQQQQQQTPQQKLQQPINTPIKKIRMCNNFQNDCQHSSYHTNNPANLKLCSGCENAMYCSTECQKQHWAEHKTNCKRLNKENKVEKGPC